MPLGQALISELLGHWLSRGQRAQESELRTLQLETLKKKLAQETQLGESYPTGFEPTPAIQEPVQLTPEEQDIQQEVYTPPPIVPVETKPGYKGMTMKDIGALHQIGLSALPPTEARPQGQVLPTGLLKSVEPAIHYETVKDEDGNVTGTQVFEGGKLKTQYDVTGKEIPLGEAPTVAPSTTVKYLTPEEAVRAYGEPKTEGFVVKAKPITLKGKITGYSAEEVADPTFTSEFKSFETWAKNQGIDIGAIKGTPEYAKKYEAYKSIGPETKAKVEEKDLLGPEDAHWLASKLAEKPAGMVPSQLRSFIGFGRVGQINLSKIVKDLRKNYPGYNFALAELSYTGDRTEINKNKSLQGNIMSFEKTAIQNAKQVDALSRKIDISRIPALNAMILTGKIMVGGTPIEAQYLAGWRTIVNEYARIATSVSGGGVTSDQARKEIETVMKSSYTPEQTQAVLRQLVLEMEHRRYGFEKNLHDVMTNWGEAPSFAPKLPTAEDIEALFQTPTPLVGAAGVGNKPVVSPEVGNLRIKYKY